MSWGTILDVGARQAVGLLLGFMAAGALDNNMFQPLSTSGAAAVVVISVLLVNAVVPVVQALWRWGISR